MSTLFGSLIKIADTLNAQGLHWVVGGSMLLEHFGLYENPHDIDIIVKKSDAQKANAVLSVIGIQKQVPVSDIFVSDFYRKFDINGTEVDLIAGFKIAHAEGIYEYAPDFDVPRDEQGIRYAALEDWYTLYLMMKKGQGKTGKLERYFSMQGYDGAYFKSILKKNLPDNVRKIINEFIK